MDTAARTGETAQTLDRGLRLLHLVADAPGGLTVTEAANRLGIGRAAVYREQRVWEPALADLGDAIRLQPKAVRGYLDRAETYLLRGDYFRAQADADEAIALDENSAEAYRLRAAAELGREDFTKAIADFTEAIRLAPKDARPLAQVLESIVISSNGAIVVSR